MRTRTAGRSAWLSGVVVGLAGGFATLEIPTLGWLVVVAFALGTLLARRVAWGVAGLLTGLGIIWIGLLGRVALTCDATASESGCHAPGIEGWLAVGVLMLVGGTALTIVAARR